MKIHNLFISCLLTLILQLPILVLAEDVTDTPKMVISMMTGEKITIDLDAANAESYEFEFFVREDIESDKRDVCLSFDKYTLEIEKIRSYTFDVKKGASSLPDRRLDNIVPLTVIYKGKDQLSIKGDEAPNICIIDLQGRACKNVKTSTDGETDINIGDLNPGIYILNIGNQSVKIIKK